MAGIREKKKARTQDDILNSALELFTEKGYTHTTIEEIAERAEVGVGTVYNYFGSKKGLLLAFAAREHESIEERGLRVIAQASDDPEGACAELLWAYMQNILSFDKKLVREITAASITEIETVGEEMARQDYRLIAQIGSLIEKYQRSGVIDKTLPVNQASLVLYSVLVMISLIYIHGGQDPDWIRETISAHICLIFCDWKS